MTLVGSPCPLYTVGTGRGGGGRGKAGFWGEAQRGGWGKRTKPQEGGWVLCSAQQNPVTGHHHPQRREHQQKQKWLGGWSLDSTLNPVTVRGIIRMHSSWLCLGIQELDWSWAPHGAGISSLAWLVTRTNTAKRAAVMQRVRKPCPTSSVPAARRGCRLVGNMSKAPCAARPPHQDLW